MKSKRYKAQFGRDYVTPFAGVWIEIYSCFRFWYVASSLPSRECGLKFAFATATAISPVVTPFAGVWIEIIELRMSLENGSSITNIK